MANRKSKQYSIWRSNYNLELNEVQSIDAKSKNLGISFEDYMELTSIFGSLYGMKEELVKLYGVEAMKAHKDMIFDCKNDEDLAALIEDGYEEGYKNLCWLRKEKKKEVKQRRNKLKAIKKELLAICKKYDCELLSEPSEMEEKINGCLTGYDWEIVDLNFDFIIDV